MELAPLQGTKNCHYAPAGRWCPVQGKVPFLVPTLPGTLTLHVERGKYGATFIENTPILSN